MATSPNKIPLNLSGDEKISIKGFIAPIENMSPNFHEEWDALANMRVNEREKEYDSSVFHAFIPNDPVGIGECWQIQENGAMELLRQLNPNPNLDMHINIGDSAGLWACLRAYNDQHAHIVFRIHAEFQFEDGWFTPSHFAGDMIIERTKGDVVYFQQYVPERRWFDVNWKKHKDEPNHFYSTASGICPKIELNSGKRITVLDSEYALSITQEEAEEKLIKLFYKSQQINWIPFEDAVKIAKEQKKLIHVLSIDGPLDDEAC